MVYILETMNIHQVEKLKQKYGIVDARCEQTDAPVNHTVLASDLTELLAKMVFLEGKLYVHFEEDRKFVKNCITYHNAVADRIAVGGMSTLKEYIQQYGYCNQELATEDSKKTEEMGALLKSLSIYASQNYRDAVLKAYRWGQYASILPTKLGVDDPDLIFAKTMFECHCNAVDWIITKKWNIAK